MRRLVQPVEVERTRIMQEVLGRESFIARVRGVQLRGAVVFSFSLLPALNLVNDLVRIVRDREEEAR